MFLKRNGIVKVKYVKLFVLNIVIVKQLALGPTIYIQMSIVAKTTITCKTYNEVKHRLYSSLFEKNKDP